MEANNINFEPANSYILHRVNLYAVIIFVDCYNWKLTKQYSYNGSMHSAEDKF